MAASVIDTAAWPLVLPLRTPLNLTGSRLIATVTAATGGEVVRLDSADGSIAWATDPVTGLTAALSVSVPVAARGDWRAVGADGRPGLVTAFLDVLRGVGGATPEENLGRSAFSVSPGTASPAVAVTAGGLRPVLTALPCAGVVLPALQTGIQGPPGRDGANGSGSATVFTQSTPAASWAITHGFGRRPIVAVYDAAGAEILTDILATPTTVTVVFASPTAGSAVLT